MYLIEIDIIVVVNAVCYSVLLGGDLVVPGVSMLTMDASAYTSIVSMKPVCLIYPMQLIGYIN